MQGLKLRLPADPVFEVVDLNEPLFSFDQEHELRSTSALIGWRL